MASPSRRVRRPTWFSVRFDAEQQCLPALDELPHTEPHFPQPRNEGYRLTISYLQFRNAKTPWNPKDFR